MPKYLAYVRLTPSLRTAAGSIKTLYGLGRETPGTHERTIEFDRLPELAEKVTAFADEIGTSTNAYIRLPDGTRKPPGFDKMRDALRYHHLDNPGPEALALGEY